MSRIKKAILEIDLDKISPAVFLYPSVVSILFISIFPLIGSLYIAFTKFKFVKGGIQFKYVGLLNFKKLLFGSQQYHFIGSLNELSMMLNILFYIICIFILLLLFKSLTNKNNNIVGKIGWIISAGFFMLIFYIILATEFNGGRFGSLITTIFYVAVGTLLQFIIGLLLAVLCVQQIKYINIFKGIFFIPLMITPVGTGYLFRMLTDTTIGPFKPLWEYLGYVDYSWATNPWGARLAVVIADSWVWIPFMFIILVSAIQTQENSIIEAAYSDGATNFQIFRFITWPNILPTTIVIIIIKIIDGFKIVDLPSVLTSGGPGISSESMTLHAFFTWRSLDLGGAAAVSYMLFITVIIISLTMINISKKYIK